MNNIAEIVNVDENSNDPIINQVADDQVQPIGEENPPNLDLHMVRRGQNVDNLVQRIQQNNVERHHNLTRVVKKILNHFVFIVGYSNKLFFMLAFPDYIQQALRGWKVHKSLTKFSEENGESIVEHVAHYTVKKGEVVANEYLKMRFFPSSLTKNAFTWFASLRPNSIHLWMQLERSFHKQFFHGEMKISSIDLFSIWWF